MMVIRVDCGLSRDLSAFLTAQLLAVLIISQHRLILPPSRLFVDGILSISP